MDKAKALEAVRGLEAKSGLTYEAFCDLLKSKGQSVNSLPDDQRQSVAREVMLMEDDWQDWNFARDVINQ